MAFYTHRVILAFCLAPACLAGVAEAQQPRSTQVTPAPFVGQGQFRHILVNDEAAEPIPANNVGSIPPGYVQLNSAMYPSPRQNIPIQVGATLITNQALAPHEMLYAHEYRAIYPPYYYKVKGSWLWTPFGIRSHDTWKLQGTEVNVKYKTSFGLFNKFRPPCVR